MPYSAESIKEKPYNRCLNCDHIGTNCDGPNFLAMEMPRLSEWCRLRKDYLHSLDPKWTNAYIAEVTDVSKTSIDRFLSGNVDDIKTSTVTRILKVLVNGTWGQYPCTMATDNSELADKLETVTAQCHRLQAMLDNSAAEHNAVLDAIRSDAQKKIDFLREQVKFKEDQMSTKDHLIDEYNAFIKRKNRIISWLSVLLGIAVVAIIAALVVDAMNPDKGFFWLASIFSETPINIFKNLL